MAMSPGHATYWRPAKTARQVMFALAETYDPNMLSAWGTPGVVSNVVKATLRYRKTLKLGINRARAA
jgi:hypothetical protein